MLADTNTAYTLYFFVDKGVIPSKDVIVNGGYRVVFHPIVLEEIATHEEAYALCTNYGMTQGNFPNFFKDIQSQGVTARLSESYQHGKFMK